MKKLYIRRNSVFFKRSITKQSNGWFLSCSFAIPLRSILRQKCNLKTSVYRGVMAIRMKKCYAIPIVLVVLGGLVLLSIGNWDECSFTEEYAIERMLKEINKASLNPKYLSNPSFSKESCSYNFLYEGGGRKISYIFTGWGEIHRWDYANGENGP